MIRASHALQAATTIAVLAGCALALRAIDTTAVLAAMRGASPAALATAAMVFALEPWLRAHALARILAPVARVPPARLLRYVLVSRAAAAAMPWRFGDVAPVVLLRAEEGVAPEATAAALLVEKAAAALALALVAAPLPFVLALPRWITAGVALLGLAAMLALVTAARVAAGWSPSHPFVRRAVEGLGVLRRPRDGAAVLALAMAQWLVDALAIVLVMRACDLDVPASAAILFELTTTAAGLVPSAAPAHLGTFEAGIVAGLALVGVARAPSLAFALLLHAAQVFPSGLAGLVALPGCGGAAIFTRVRGGVVSAGAEAFPSKAPPRDPRR